MANTPQNIIKTAKQMISDGWVYLYGGKGSKITKDQVEQLAKLYPGVFSASIKTASLKKVGKIGIDCSGFVCRAAGISHIGSTQIKDAATKTWSIQTLTNIKNGMFIWRSGHIGIIEVDSAGKRWILEAQSTNNDLKRTAFDSRYKSFTHYGEIKGVDYTKGSTGSGITNPAPDSKLVVRSKMKVNAKSGLNVRNSYSETALKLGALPLGKIVEVNSIGVKWAKIIYGNRYGYVVAKYLSKI